ncbi:MAG: tetratricopeptide repeat protein [Gammaproteobacteria bacterium]
MWRTLVLTLLISIPAAHAASNKDWVLEQRFKSQLTAAQRGDKQAQLEIGRMYEKGRGVDQNMQKAVQWLARSAAQGQPTAKAELGIIYYEGNGVQPDYDKAFVLLSAAAAANVPSAQFYLGRIYEEGKGTRQNLNVALKWYRQAATNGYYPARAKVTAVRSALASHEAPKPKPTAVHKDQNVGDKTQKAVLAGAWTYNNKAVAYLPSSATVCTPQDGGAVECVSNHQKRTIGTNVITYRTRARLSGFKSSGDFSVAYTNEIIKVESTKKDDKAAESAAKRLAGQHEAEHTLVCKLKDTKHIDCRKDKFLDLAFVKAAGK